MKKWLIENFLPMWAKETVLAENRRLQKQIRHLSEDSAYTHAYIQGLEAALHAAKRIRMTMGDNR